MSCKNNAHRATGLGCLIFAGLLSGCVAPPPYDVDAVNVAVAQQRASSDGCFARARARQFSNVRQFTDCLVAGKSQFVQTIKLRQMEYFTAYTQRMNILGDEADAKTIPAKDFGDRLVSIETDFDQTLGAAYQQNQTERVKASNALSAMGRSLQQAGAAMQAQQPGINPSVTCTTMRTGIMNTTTCN